MQATIIDQYQDRLEGENSSVNPLWLKNRKQLENIRFGRYSPRQLSQGKLSRIDYILPYFIFGLKTTFLYQQGVKNARNIVIREHELFFEDLPEAFDGYRILHLTDLHLDSLPGIENTICECIDALQFDVSVFTGDYRWHGYGEYPKEVLSGLNSIFTQAEAADGVYATLGNHDTHQLVSHLEDMPVQLLSNESVRIHRDDQYITFTGTDDPHNYHTMDAVRSLDQSGSGFKVALIHSPELYQEAAEADYQFYLCGHTHGGQVCLPSGLPIVRNLSKGRRLVKGFWKHKNMLGYTSAGCGVSGAPVRFFSRGEITRFTLRRKGC